MNSRANNSSSGIPLHDAPGSTTQGIDPRNCLRAIAGQLFPLISLLTASSRPTSRRQTPDAASRRLSPSASNPAARSATSEISPTVPPRSSRPWAPLGANERRVQPCMQRVSQPGGQSRRGSGYERQSPGERRSRKAKPSDQSDPGRLDAPRHGVMILAAAAALLPPSVFSLSVSCSLFLPAAASRLHVETSYGAEDDRIRRPRSPPVGQASESCPIAQEGKWGFLRRAHGQAWARPAAEDSRVVGWKMPCRPRTHMGFRGTKRARADSTPITDFLAAVH